MKSPHLGLARGEKSTPRISSRASVSRRPPQPLLHSLLPHMHRVFSPSPSTISNGVLPSKSRAARSAPASTSTSTTSPRAPRQARAVQRRPAEVVEGVDVGRAPPPQKRGAAASTRRAGGPGPGWRRWAGGAPPPGRGRCRPRRGGTSTRRRAMAAWPLFDADNWVLEAASSAPGRNGAGGD